ncbi:CPBP family intramembrane glutamic endopeptidase [Lentisalinibacter sediminis]|uniref:CPBP family intramembrane glutamic endopeptidase n=1 Tax=Lentisalinibacter sediminis TaxID=2992237 RepID=UPI003863D844
MDALAVSANLILIAILFAMFVEAVGRRLFAPPWLRYGLAAAALLVAADLAVYLIEAEVRRVVPVWFYLIATAILIARAVTETVVGLAAAERLGLKPLPLLRPRTDAGHRGGALAVVGAGIGCGLGIAAWSAALFLVTAPGPAAGGELAPWEMPEGAALAWFLTALVVTSLGEELTFRLGIQNYFGALFGRGAVGYWAAIVLSSVLWSLGHIGRVDPEWVKFAQIFPAGLLLGWLFRRMGFEACVIAHAVLNLIMPFATPKLLG